MAYYFAGGKDDEQVRLDFDGKNWAIRIMFVLAMIFFSVAIALSLGIRPETRTMGQKVWETFTMAIGGLFLLLNAEGKKQIGVEDLPPDSAAQQTTTVTTPTTQATQQTTISTAEPEQGK